MKRFALIGHPVAGSLSPVLFDAAYSGRYPYDLIDAPFPEAWSKFLNLYQGINITAPYKQEAYAAVEALSEEARLSGAVNLAVKGADGLLHGYNTDIEGVAGAVRETGLSVDNAVIIGAGGAARAAVIAAWKLGCKSITIVNRTYEKAAFMAASINEVWNELSAFPQCSARPELNVLPLSELPGLRPGLVVYTVPGAAGIVPGLTESVLKNAAVLEAEYKHPVLSGITCRKYIGGKRWLLWQAVAGYSLFTGEEADFAAMEACI